MSALLIRQALEVALAAMSPAMSTAYENVPFVPVNGTPYQRAYIMMTEPDNPEMGAYTQDMGFMQVSLCYPLDTGPADALARAELIRSTFKRGYSFTASGIVVTVERTPEIGPAMLEEDRFVIPVRIRFYSNHAG
jgi:Bacteriophage related domain of unknown function